MKKGGVLMLLCCVIITACCIDDTPDPIGNPPQPIDERLLGSWQYGNVTVTFSENNECFIEHGDSEDSRNGYVRNNIIILPGRYDHRTKRFPEYEYGLDGDSLLSLKEVPLPPVDCGNFTLQAYPPAIISKGTFKKSEE